MDLINNSHNPKRFSETELTTEEKTLSMLMYLLGMFTSFLGPLIIYVLKKDESEFIHIQGKNYFNFMISYGIYIILSLIFTVILIGVVPLIICSIAFYVYSFIGMAKINQGEDYFVPFSLQFMK